MRIILLFTFLIGVSRESQGFGSGIHINIRLIYFPDAQWSACFSVTLDLVLKHSVAGACSGRRATFLNTDAARYSD